MSNLIFPVKNGYITHGFDELRGSKIHGGYDIGSKESQAYNMAVCDCKVVLAGWSPSFGFRAWIEPIDKELKKKYPFIVYGHCEKLYCKTGQMLKSADLIGKMGDTGMSKGRHLHIEARTKIDTTGKSIRILEFES